MSNQEYFQNVLLKYRSVIDELIAEQIRKQIESQLTQWGNGAIKEIKLSGSYAKKTNTSLSSDFDIFISFTSSTTQPIKEIYVLLETKLKSLYPDVRRQNVSLGLTINGKKVDIVPAKNHSGNTNDHWLYSTKKDSYFQTNIHKQINIIYLCNRPNEIKLTKIWSKLHKLDFPSIYIELMVIDALNGCAINNFEPNFQKVLEHIANNLETRRIVDPANTANVISDSLTQQEKKIIALKAKEGYDSKSWSGVIW
jgi:predicted nucleotidyltransferase